jgi:hypothetical protein
MYDDEASPSEAGSESSENNETKSDETEEQLALVPNSFFKKPPKPAMQEMVEVVNVYENECSIKCIYKDEKEEEGMEEEEVAPEPEPEDEMMA